MALTATATDLFNDATTRHKHVAGQAGAHGGAGAPADAGAQHGGANAGAAADPAAQPAAGAAANAAAPDAGAQPDAAANTPAAPDAAAQAGANAGAAAGLTATDLFNDATTRLVGGVGPDQVDKVVADLKGVQQMLSAADPQINNLSDLHTQIIINQLNEEIASVQDANSANTHVLGTNLGQFVGRSINDIHRDIIDIAQGDAGVQALFNPTPLPDLVTAATPFQDNADQTKFLTQFIQDSNHLGQMATAIANNHFQGDIAGLVQQIQTYAANASAFDQSQGELYSARFWNELREDGTAGTAANALIEGLQTQNAGEVSAAAEQLSTNASDVGSNNVMAGGASYADVIAAAQATTATPQGQGQGMGQANGHGMGQGHANNGGAAAGAGADAAAQAGAGGNPAAADNGNAGGHAGHVGANGGAGADVGAAPDAGAQHGGTNGGAAAHDAAPLPASNQPAPTTMADVGHNGMDNHVALPSPAADMAHQFHHMWG
jgi:hypothetical protein